MGGTACAEPQCLYKGALYLYLYHHLLLLHLLHLLYLLLFLFFNYDNLITLSQNFFFYATFTYTTRAMSIIITYHVTFLLLLCKNNPCSGRQEGSSRLRLPDFKTIGT